MGFKEYIVHKFYTHRTGILGTVIFHLLLAIVLLSVGISRMKIPSETEIEMLTPLPGKVHEILEEKQRKEELRRKTSAQEVQQLLRSIAVNENARNRQARTADIQSYIDEVTEELERENYGGRYNARKDRNYRQDSLRHASDQQEQLLDSLKSVFYSGKSSVSYNLAGRYARFLPIPVFKCEFGGRVVVEISVDRRGKVQKAHVIASASEDDDCLYEVAVDAALRSSFNEKSGAAALQIGTITFNFVKQ